MIGEDHLIERTLAGSVTDADWSRLDGLAGHDPEVWRRVAEAARDQFLLGAAVGKATAVADRVELPSEIPAISPAPTARRSPLALGAWGGWAAAAVVAVAWVVTSAGEPPPPARTATPAPTMEEALDLYRETAHSQGRLLGELPLVLVSSEPGPSEGSTQVVVLRRMLERMTVAGMAEPGRDELGRTVPVPISGRPLELTKEL